MLKSFSMSQYIVFSRVYIVSQNISFEICPKKLEFEKTSTNSTDNKHHDWNKLIDSNFKMKFVCLQKRKTTLPRGMKGSKEPTSVECSFLIKTEPKRKYEMEKERRGKGRTVICGHIGQGTASQ